MIEIKNLVKSYDKNPILKDISFKIDEGEILSIIGKSGSGKSTILRCLAMLEEIDSGQILLNDKPFNIYSKDIAEYRKQVSMVFQKYNLFSNMTVLQNIILAPVVTKYKTEQEAIEIAKDLLKSIKLLDKIDSYPNQLSGGEQQRVAIIRALAMDPQYLLLDEVTSALDPEMIKEVLMLIKKLSKKGISVVLVTHHIEFAKEISDKVMFIDEGEIKEIGTPKEIFEETKNHNLKTFLNKISN